jgi:hypothetical protein
VVSGIIQKGGAGPVQPDSAGAYNLREIFGVAQGSLGSAFSGVSYDSFAANVAKQEVMDALQVHVNLPTEKVWRRFGASEVRKMVPPYGDINNTKFVDNYIAAKIGESTIDLKALWSNWKAMMIQKNGVDPRVPMDDFIPWVGQHWQDRGFGQYFKGNGVFMVKEDSPQLREANIDLRLEKLEKAEAEAEKLVPGLAEAVTGAVTEVELTEIEPAAEDIQTAMLKTLQSIDANQVAMAKRLESIESAKRAEGRGIRTDAPAKSGSRAPVKWTGIAGVVRGGAA